MESCSWKDFVRTSKLIKNQIGCISYFHNEDGKSESEPRKLHDDPGSIGMYLICKEMRSRGFNSVLSGTGADEIFTGYYDHYLYWLYEMRCETNFNQLVEEMKIGYGSHINNPLLKNPFKIWASYI